MFGYIRYWKITQLEDILKIKIYKKQSKQKTVKFTGNEVQERERNHCTLPRTPQLLHRATTWAPKSLEWHERWGNTSEGAWSRGGGWEKARSLTTAGTWRYEVKAAGATSKAESGCVQECEGLGASVFTKSFIELRLFNYLQVHLW